MTDPFISDSNCGETCVVCGKSVAGGRGYSHIQHEGESFALCCPLCLETFQKKPGYYTLMKSANETLHHPNPPN